MRRETVKQLSSASQSLLSYQNRPVCIFCQSRIYRTVNKSTRPASNLVSGTIAQSRQAIPRTSPRTLSRTLLGFQVHERQQKRYTSKESIDDYLLNAINPKRSNSRYDDFSNTARPRRRWGPLDGEGQEGSGGYDVTQTESLSSSSRQPFQYSSRRSARYSSSGQHTYSQSTSGSQSYPYPRSVHTQPEPAPYNPELVDGWQHLRRQNGMPGQGGYPGEGNLPFGNNDITRRQGPTNPRHATYLRESQQRLEETQNGQFVGLTDKRVPICRYCKVVGHVIADCPKVKTLYCTGCGMNGHVLSKCPHRQMTEEELRTPSFARRGRGFGGNMRSRESSRLPPAISRIADVGATRPQNANGMPPPISKLEDINASDSQTARNNTPVDGILTSETRRRSPPSLHEPGPKIAWTPAPIPGLENVDTSPPLMNNFPGRYAVVDDVGYSPRFNIQEPDDEYSLRGSRQRRRRSKQKSIDDRFDLSYEPDGDLNPIEDKRRAKERKRDLAAKKAAEAVKSGPTPIFLPDFISVSNLAVALKVPVAEFIRRMEDLGFEGVSNDHVLNAENAGLIAMEYDFEPAVDRSDEEDLRAQPVPEDKTVLPSRPPVVTIMGHVDHGKTTILDYLRKSAVAASEHGGITQHIGAFSVPLAPGKAITFLDTPGHAAFLRMRERGANVTDIVVLVVAADDGIKPQTVEAIKHAKAARVPIIVAINKIDKDEAAPERIKAELARKDIDVEDFGGETQVVEISGKTGKGVDKLEEAIITLSEILDHRAPTDGAVEGWVLEATRSRKGGRAATLLIRQGTLRKGDVIVAGTTWARVRMLRNESGAEVEEATPGLPVEVEGWRGQAVAGDEVLQAPDEHKASAVVKIREEKKERQRLAEDTEAINQYRKLEQEKREREEAAARAAKAAQKGRSRGPGNSYAYAPDQSEEQASSVQEESSSNSKAVQAVNLVVKADVSGSVEAILNAVGSLGNNEVQPRIIRSSVGAVTESDIELATAAQGFVICFNVAVDPKLAHQAEMQKVEIIEQNIIYRLVDVVRAKLSEKLPPAVVAKVTGEAEVLQLFGINVKRRKDKLMIAGCKVRNGTMTKGSRVRVVRGGARDVVYEGEFLKISFLFF